MRVNKVELDGQYGPGNIEEMVSSVRSYGATTHAFSEGAFIEVHVRDEVDGTHYDVSVEGASREAWHFVECSVNEVGSVVGHAMLAESLFKESGADKRGPETAKQRWLRLTMEKQRAMEAFEAGKDAEPEDLWRAFKKESDALDAFYVSQNMGG